MDPLQTLKRRVSEETIENESGEEEEDDEKTASSSPITVIKKLLAGKCQLCNGYLMVLKCDNCDDKYHLECVGFEDVPQGKKFFLFFWVYDVCARGPQTPRTIRVSKKCNKQT